MEKPSSVLSKILTVIPLREKGSHRTRVVIRPDYALTSSDRMVVLGAAKDLKHLRNEV